MSTYTIPRDRIAELIRQRYPNGGERVLLFGPPGTGKNAMAVALATMHSQASSEPVSPPVVVAPPPSPKIAEKCQWGPCSNMRLANERYCAGHLGVLTAINRAPRVEPKAPPVVHSAPTSDGSRPWWQCTLTSESLESRIWWGLYPNKEGGMDERMGPGALSWANGGLWLVHELHRGSADCHERIIMALDDSSFATDTSPLGTVLKPNPRFGCIATQNAPSNVLSDALRDRFAMRIAVLRPPQAALDKLDPDVRLHVERSYDAIAGFPSKWEEGPSPSFRDCLSFCEMRRAGIDERYAAEMVLDSQGQEPQGFLDSLAMLKTEVQRQTAAQETVTVTTPDHHSVAFFGGERYVADGGGNWIPSP